jgi:hypothetical protein
MEPESSMTNIKLASALPVRNNGFWDISVSSSVLLSPVQLEYRELLDEIEPTTVKSPLHALAVQRTLVFPELSFPR